MCIVDAMNLYRGLLSCIIIIIIDIPWLYIQSGRSQKIVKDISGSFQLRLWAALPVYIALAYLLLQQTSLMGAFLSGLAVYAVYDFTTLALFKKYPLSFALIDTLWGGVVMSIAYLILNGKIPRPM